MILLGDFNVHHQEWLDSSRTSTVGRSLQEFCELNGLVQLVHSPTRGSSILDLIITPYCGTVYHHPPLGTSDHVTLFASFSLSLEITAPPPSRKVFHWRSAPWPHICGYFRRINWDRIKDGTVDDATAFLTSSLVSAQDRYVPSSIPTLHRPTVWWNRYCQRTYLTKLRLWDAHDSNAFS